MTGRGSSSGKAEEFTLLGVADGVGGEPGGNIASNVGLRVFLAQVLSQLEAGVAGDQLRIVTDAIEFANSSIISLAESRPELKGMSTTITACLLRDFQCVVGHVGDSRLYLIRDQSIRLVTEDHSRNGVVWGLVGATDKVKVFTAEFRLRPGDQILLCSDGLTNRVQEDALLQILLRPRSLNWKCEKLVIMANERGGNDNISTVLAQVTI